MNGKPSKALMFKESLNQGLAETVLELDREHYPESLLEIIEAVVLDLSCPRGLPLMAFAMARARVDAEQCYQSAEMLWQGMLLTAILAAEEKPTDGLAAGLMQGFSQAHLLLTADTLLTMPFEFCAGSKGADRAGRLASASRAAIGALAGSNGQLSHLEHWRPADGLLTEFCPGGVLPDVPGMKAMINLAFAGDLIRWLGPSQWLEAMRRRAMEESGLLEDSSELNRVRQLLTV